jgi:solute carrier family 8 (sodium/calcium exchanger)
MPVLQVDYWTQDGTALAGPDYVPLKSSVTFNPGETQKQVMVEVIDDDVFEEDEHFFIHMGNLVSIVLLDVSNIRFIMQQ